MHDHNRIEEDTSTTIRVRIIHYHDLVASHSMSPLVLRQDASHGSSPQSTSKSIYHVGQTKAGYWTCTPGSFAVTTPRPTTECFHVLEGVFFLTNMVDGTSRRCVAGDTVVLPKGWTGHWDIVEAVQKLWVEV